MRATVAARILQSLRAGMLLLTAVSSAAPAETGLEARFDRMLAEEGLQGMVWSLVTPDGTHAGAAGVSDAASGATMHVDEHVQVGSIAKTVLALGVLRLASEGRVELDAPVRSILPEVAFDNPWEASEPVRVRHLLDHTAGIDDARLGQVFSARARPDTPLVDAISEWPDVLRVRSRPGTRTSYSNTGYTILGMLVEHVTGERYELWLDANLLHRLGPADSTATFTTQGQATTSTRWAMGHFENGVRQATLPTLLRPATQFSTTAKDMARLAEFLLGDGRVDGEVFIDATLLRAMGAPRGTLAADAGLRVGYALGLAARDRHGAVGLCHGGSTVGFRASLCLFPEARRAFFVAWNTDSETADHARFEKVLVEALGVATPKQPRGASVTVDSAWNGRYVPSPNRFAMLAWIDMLFAAVDVKAQGAAVRLTPFAARPIELESLDGHLLRAPGRAIASHVLLVDRDGQRVLATGAQNYQLLPAWQWWLPWSSLVLLILGLAWVFVRGSARVFRRRLGWRDALFVPWLGVLALLSSLPLFFLQSLFAIGDRTPASIALAITSAVLPIAMLAGLPRSARGRGVARVDALALLAVVQGTFVLAGWGLWPIRLWT